MNTNIKLSYDKICEYIIYIYLLIIMASSSTGTLLVKGIRLIVVFFFVIRIIKSKKLNWSFYSLWGIIFMVYNLIMTKYSYDISTSLDYTLTLMYVIIPNILMAQFIIEKKNFNKIFKIIILGSLLKGIFTFAQYGPLVFLNARFTDDTNANVIGMYSGIAFALCYYLSKIDSKNKVKYLFFAILSILFVILSASRKAIMFIIIPIIIYGIMKSKNPIKTAINFCSIAILLGSIYYSLFHVQFLYDLVGNRIESMISGFSGGTTDGSTSTRLHLIEEGIDLFKQKPVLGHGPATFRVLNAGRHSKDFYAHNNYIELLVDDGIVGLILYYILHFKIIVSYIKNKLKIKKENLIIIAILISLMICDYGMVSYYEVFVQFLLMTLLMFFYHDKNKKGVNINEK